MIDLVQSRLPQIQELCKKHKVKSIALFGSATREDFNEELSDLDFVVEFTDELDLMEYADNFFSLLDSLKQLLNIKIDLITYRSLKNELLISEIEKTKQNLYAA